MTISDEDKNNILKQHSTFYNGYATGNVPSNIQPLRQDNGPKDTMGINVNNRGEVSTYKNHMVNEQKLDFPPKFGDEIEDYSSLFDNDTEGIDFPPEFGDEKEDYESLMDNDTEGINFPPEFGDEEEDYSYSEGSYGMDINSIMSMFDGSITADLDGEFDGHEEYEGEVPAYEFDSEGAMDTDLYEEEQCEGCGGEMYEEKEVCNECGGEMREGECMECGTMYEEIDSDLRESFFKEKQRISEMFDRFNKFN